MRRKGSRYENTQPFSSDSSFEGFREREVNLPAGIVEHTVLHTDRLDQLANAYYKEDRRWWRILDANPDFLYGFEIFDTEMLGDVIPVPAARGRKK